MDKMSEQSNLREDSKTQGGERETSTDQGKTSQTTQDQKEEFVPKKGAISVMCHVDILWIFHFKIKPTKQCNEITRCVARSRTKAKQLHRLKTLEESFTGSTSYKKKLRRWKEIKHYNICKAMVLICTLLKKWVWQGMQCLAASTCLKLSCHVYGEMPEQNKKQALYCPILKQPQTCDEAPHKLYLSSTAHFIKYFLEDHTGKMITKNLRQALESWRLQ